MFSLLSTESALCLPFDGGAAWGWNESWSTASLKDGACDNRALARPIVNDWVFESCGTTVKPLLALEG